LGKPVIASKIGGIPELLNLNTGFLFEPSSKMSLLEVINTSNKLSEDSYLAMSRNCLEFAKKYFSKKNHYLNLINIYKSIKK
jgi:glycosyltransferase involved in cell wall biosynthesis